MKHNFDMEQTADAYHTADDGDHGALGKANVRDLFYWKKKASMLADCSARL